MLIVRFRETFRERQMEWCLTGGAAGWGLILLQPAPVFTRPFYATLAQIAPEAAWGWGMFLVGLWGLVVLFINGSWHRTPAWRQFASIARLAAWSGLLFGALAYERQVPGAALYAMIFVMEALALNNAAKDGKRISRPVDGR